LVQLLHKNSKYRFKNLEQVKNSLVDLRKSIFETPKLLRQVLSHPVLPEEELSMLDLSGAVIFKGKEVSKFALKYFAKFICEYPIDSLSLNGGNMPIRSIQTNNLISLSLRDSQLFSEDLFLLSQVMKDNKSIEHIDLSKNLIGFTFFQERKILEMKMKNISTLKDQTFDK
jgi:hypothetical protein